MIIKERLTNEKLNKMFDSPFSLVIYAIKQAKIKMARGDVRTSNVAIEALDLLDREGIQEQPSEEALAEMASARLSEKKKEGAPSRKRKDPLLYSWSDVK